MRKYKSVLLFLGFVFCLSLLVACRNSEKPLTLPVVLAGSIDLRGMELAEDYVIPLKGQWEFYWEQLLEPTGFNAKQVTPEYLQFPGAWNIQQGGNPVYPVTGYATCRLTILCDPLEEVLGLYLGDVSTACRIFLDDRLLYSKGVVASRAADFHADFNPEIIYFSHPGKKMVLTIQIANFLDRLGGITEISLGNARSISHFCNSRLAIDLFITGCLIIIGFYYLTMFMLQKLHHSTLYFGIFCLIIGLRTLLMGQRYMYVLFPGLPFSLLMGLEFLTIPLGVSAMLNFFRKLYDFSWFKYVNITTLVASGLFILCVLFFPLLVYEKILVAYLVVVVFAFSIMIYGLVRGIRTKKEGAAVFLGGFVFLFATLINDLLHYNGLVNTGYLVPFGFLILVLFQSFILSVRFTKAFHDVEELSKRLLSLDKLKDTFLINTSHELRTPLHGIIGLSENLRDGVAGKINKQQFKIISLIQVSAKRLVNLVNDILDFSRMKRNQIVLKKVALDLHEICNIVILFTNPLLGNKDLKLINSIPEGFPLVEGDANRIQQILHNLIGNAVKFTPMGKVEISARQDGAMAWVEVQDTGIGIASEKLDTIFESFEQVIDKSAEKVFGGTGLGLSITKQLVEYHGGELKVSSVPGKGSQFTFSIALSMAGEKFNEEFVIDHNLLEVADLEPVDEIPASGEPVVVDGNGIHSNQKMRILVVDDEPVHLNIISDMLSVLDCSLSLASDGTKALALMEHRSFDIILLDIMMPGMSGYLVCRQIRKKYSANELPVIMLSGRNYVSDMVEGLQSGANDYLAKPFSRGELTARLGIHYRLAKINTAYNRFVPARFLKLLGKESFIDVNPGDHVLRNMTILFCDIRSFMTLSEKLTPRQNFQFLNSYYEKMTPVIVKHNGFIDKYIGDEIMALFPDNPEDALKAALEMKQVVETYNSFRIKTGYDPISIGIGIHSGPMILGTIGDKNRMEGTVISDAVNVAARLEGLTKLYGGSIIISSAIFHSIQNPINYFFRFLGLVQVKGKHEAVHIYEFFDESHDDLGKTATKDLFELGLQQYFSRNFNVAVASFNEVLDKNPADKAARLYLERCREYSRQVILEDWDGVEAVGIKL